MDELINLFDIVGDSIALLEEANLEELLSYCEYLKLTAHDISLLAELADHATVANFFGGDTPFAAPLFWQEEAQIQVEQVGAIQTVETDGGNTSSAPKKPPFEITIQELAGAAGSVLAGRVVERFNKNRTTPQQTVEMPVQSASTGICLSDRNEDLFRLQDSKSVSMVRCACGGIYPFFEARPCAVCGGHDPLGFLWEAHQPQIVKILQSLVTDGCCSAPMGLFSVLNAIQQDLEAALSRANDPSRLGDLEGLEDHWVAKKLIDFFDPLFTANFLSGESIERLKQTARNEASLIVDTLCSAANHYRGELVGPAFEPAWQPTPSFKAELSLRLYSIWQPSLNALGSRVSHAFLKAAASYHPVRTAWQKRSIQPDDTKTLIQWAWRGVKAVKTMGISLAVEVGMHFVKGAIEQNQYACFSQSVTHAFQECVALQRMISEATSKHRDLLTHLGGKLTNHILFSLAETYGPATPAQQYALADQIANFSGIPDWRTDAFLERGKEALARRRRARLGKRLLIAIAVLILAACATALFAYYLLPLLS